MSSKDQNGVSNRKLRRLVSRARYIVQKHRAANPAFEVAADPMVIVFDAFTSAHDRYEASASSKRAEVATGREKVDALQSTVRTWLPLVRRDTDVDTTRFRLNTQVPEDTIGAARLLITVIEEALQRGVELPYAGKAIETVNVAITEAETEWHEARTAITNRQDEAAVVRQAAAAAQNQLVALRQMLLAAVGRSDLDYQALRLSRGNQSDDEKADEKHAQDEEADGSSPAVDTPETATQAETEADPEPQPESGDVTTQAAAS